MTLASVNVNFTLALGQHFTAEEAERKMLDILDPLVAQIGCVIEVEVLPGTQTKADPFKQAQAIPFNPAELQPYWGGGLGPRA